jgi:hypothetical protein
MDANQIKELANSSSHIVWEGMQEARQNNPVFKHRRLIMQAMEKALTELEMGWVREGMGSDKISGIIKIELFDENEHAIVCSPAFSRTFNEDE